MTPLLTWFNIQKPLVKILLVVALVLSGYGVYASIGKAVYKYKYFKEVEQQYITAKDSINALNLRIKDLTQKQQNRTKRVQKKSKDINDKLKADETIINNTPVNDDELNDYISKHENG